MTRQRRPTPEPAAAAVRDVSAQPWPDDDRAPDEHDSTDAFRPPQPGRVVVPCAVLVGVAVLVLAWRRRRRARAPKRKPAT